MATVQALTKAPAPDDGTRKLYDEWDQYLRIGLDDGGAPWAELRHQQVKIVAYQDGEDDDLLHVEVHASDSVPIHHDHQAHRKPHLTATDLQVRANGPNQLVIESLWADVTVTYQELTKNGPSTTVTIDGHASVERHDFDARYL